MRRAGVRWVNAAIRHGVSISMRRPQTRPATRPSIYSSNSVAVSPAKRPSNSEPGARRGQSRIRSSSQGRKTTLVYLYLHGAPFFGYLIPEADLVG